MTDTTDPQTGRTSAIYDAIDAFQRTHRLPGLQHAQIRGLLAEHLDRALPVAAPSAPADRSGLRERITEAIDRVTGGTCPGDIIDAVLSVLPPAADRGASYRHAADTIESMQGYPRLILPEEIVAALRLLAAGEQPEPGSPAYIRRLADEERDEQQAQANLDQLADGLAAAIASCPGRELDPSPCRCPCYGCKHHCGAHDPGRVGGEEQQPEKRQSCACGQEGCEYCDVDEEKSLLCPRCGNDITGYAEDDHVFRTGDERPYCSGECVVAAHRAGLPTGQPPADAGEEEQPRFVRVCIACPECDHTLDENGACANSCHVPPAVVAEPGKENGS